MPGLVHQDRNVGTRYLVTSVFFFFLLALAGVYLRLRYVYPLLPGLEFDNVINAHSHVAYSGWASLALMGGTYLVLPRFTGRTLVAEGWARIQFWIIILTTLAAFFGFGAVGYEPITIALGTILGLSWYTHAVVVLLNVRHVPRPRPFAVGAISLSVLYLVIATMGTWLVTGITVAGLEDELWKNAGLYLFLHNFVDGWLFIGVLGLIAAESPGLAARLDSRLGAMLLWALGLLTAPGFLVWLQPYGLDPAIFNLGYLARGLTLIPYAILLVLTARAFRDGAAARLGTAYWFLAAAWVAFAFFVLMQLLTVIVPQSLAWGQMRNFFIGYLHTQVLGVVSGALSGLIYLWAVKPGKPARLHFVGYAAGTAGMIAALFAAGFAQVLSRTELLGLFLELSFAFSILALAGVTAFLWGIVSPAPESPQLDG